MKNHLLEEVRHMLHPTTSSYGDPKGVGHPLSGLIPKGRSPFFGPFLEFGQAIVDAIFVQKISNF
jgi:hypothetical protein